NCCSAIARRTCPSKRISMRRVTMLSIWETDRSCFRSKVGRSDSPTGWQIITTWRRRVEAMRQSWLIAAACTVGLDYEAKVVPQARRLSRLARSASRNGVGVVGRLLQKGFRQAKHHLAGISCGSALLRLD